MEQPREGGWGWRHPKRVTLIAIAVNAQGEATAREIHVDVWHPKHRARHAR